MDNNQTLIAQCEGKARQWLSPAFDEETRSAVEAMINNEDKADLIECFYKDLEFGTGIGAGVIQRGEFIGGVGHPEMGHYYVARHPMDIEKEFNGVCPFHKGCLEGFAAGPSLEARTGVREL